jgi:hypothetical protein
LPDAVSTFVVSADDVVTPSPMTSAPTMSTDATWRRDLVNTELLPDL